MSTQQIFKNIANSSSLDDTKPRKRINLSIKLQSDYTSTLPLFTQFLRLSDHLTSASVRRAKSRSAASVASTRRRRPRSARSLPTS
jgi:hypothetical protein